ncbi:MAG TPA: hypothetical protein VMV68_04505 [Spirochaetia bacterium]|nr:hypothetical protein [Spirochaetia bacterium]
MSRAIAVGLLFLVVCSYEAYAQTTGGSTEPSGTAPAASDASGATPSTATAAPSAQPGAAGTQPSAAAPTGPQPVPYSPDEFPLWMRDARRAEVITIGAFPITLLVSSFSYQLYRYFSNGSAAAYAPSLFGGAGTPLTDSEKSGVLIGGLGAAALVALADFIIGRVQGSE